MFKGFMSTFLDAHTCHFYIGVPPGCILPRYIQPPLLFNTRFCGSLFVAEWIYRRKYSTSIKCYLEVPSSSWIWKAKTKPVTFELVGKSKPNLLEWAQRNRHSAWLTPVYSVFCYLWFIHGFNILQVHSQLLSLFGFFTVHLKNSVMSLFQLLRNAKLVERIVSLRFCGPKYHNMRVFPLVIYTLPLPPWNGKVMPH